MSIAIEVTNVSKQYRLGQIGTGTLSHDLNRFWHKARGKEDPYLKIGAENDRTQKSDGDYVWALQDINFDVNQGEVLGIIGRNGAGKSTLLKILSRTTSPTIGNIKIKGRIASLLEVGTGFHPELSGRDNVFLNGAILGMTKSEIKNKFDEIVDFAGVERYIDTPVKRYSSGMYVRLAFGVAAHLQSEILIVDEVLAVGDADFQKKCLGKMKDISKGEGRTVLFVSHNMASVKSLCSRGIMLQNGLLTLNGHVNDVVASYLSDGAGNTNYKQFLNNELSKDDIEITLLKIHSKDKNKDDAIIEGEAIELCINLKIENGKSDDYHLTFHLHNSFGEVIFSFSHIRDNLKLKNGTNHLVCKFPEKFFNTGTYYVKLLVVKDRKNVIIEESDILSFTVINQQKEIGTWMGREPGDIKPGFVWEHLV